MLFFRISLWAGRWKERIAFLLADIGRGFEIEMGSPGSPDFLERVKMLRNLLGGFLVCELPLKETLFDCSVFLTLGDSS